MSNATLTYAAFYGIVVGLVYAYVGYRVSQRKVSREAALAQNLFVTWWYALGASTVLGAIQVLLYLGDALTVTLHNVFGQVNLLLVVVALLGLLYYLVYLYTGSRRALVPLTLFYAAFYVALLVLVYGSPPEGLTDDGWSIQAEPEIEWSPGTLWALIIALLVPQIGASLALFRLYFRVEGRTQKYRLLLLASAIFVWFGTVLVAAAVGLGELSWWPPVSRLLGLGAALTVLVAYHPPKWVQHRYGVTSIVEEEAA